MAGLYDVWREGGESGATLRTFTILTTDSSKRLNWYTLLLSPVNLLALWPGGRPGGFWQDGFLQVMYQIQATAWQPLPQLDRVCVPRNSWLCCALLSACTQDIATLHHALPRRLHDRMPVLLRSPEEEEAWLAAGDLKCGRTLIPLSA